MTLSLEETVELLGDGELDLSRLPVPELASAFGAARQAVDFCNHILCSRLSSLSISMHLVASSSSTCSAHEIGTGAHKFIVMIPAGLVCRLAVTIRLLLKHWEGPRVAMANSPLDDLDGSYASVPPLLRPVFSSYEGSEARERLWQDVRELFAFIELKNNAEYDMLELMHLAVVHLVCHEYAHITEGHFTLLHQRPTAEEFKAHNMHRNDISKAVELHADAVAAQLSAKILMAQVEAAAMQGKEDHVAAGFLRFSYVLTMLHCALNDPIRKYLYGYDGDTYAHPLVRLELTFASFNIVLSSTGKQLWSEMSRVGWSTCLWALNMVNLEAMQLVYGPTNLAQGFGPLHINPGLWASANHIAKKTERAFSLTLRIRELIIARSRPSSN